MYLYRRKSIKCFHNRFIRNLHLRLYKLARVPYIYLIPRHNGNNLQNFHCGCVGIRSCAPLASFLAFYFHMIFPDVRQVQTNSSSEIFEQMIRITEDDVVIGISFPRYSMRTMKALEFANSRKAKVITITDSVHSPMNVYAACTLIAKSDMASIVDSLVAPLSVINALVVALCMKRQADVKKTLESMEKLWDEYQVYSNDEINGLDDARPMGGKKAALPVKEKA